MDTFLYPVSISGFIIVTLLAYGWTIKTFNSGMSAAGFSASRRNKMIFGGVACLLLWTTFISVASAKGFFADFSSFPPRIAVVFIVPLIVVLILTFSKIAGEILPSIPVQALIRIQVFRVFVEILLWMLLVQNLLPVQMTVEGRNFDILTGMTAPILAWLISKQARSSTAVVLWNIAGLLLLLNVVIIAVLSIPTPFRVFMNEPSNSIIATFPFVWLPGLLVPLAYCLHFLSIRQAMMSPTRNGGR